MPIIIFLLLTLASCSEIRDTPKAKIITASVEYIQEEYFTIGTADSIYALNKFNNYDISINHHINSLNKEYCCIKIDTSIDVNMFKEVNFHLKQMDMISRENFSDYGPNSFLLSFTEPLIIDNKSIVVVNIEKFKFFASLLLLLEKKKDKWIVKHFKEIAVG